MKCRLIRDMECRPTPEFPDGIKPQGTEIEHPQAPLLVESGVAEPADEECCAMIHQSPVQLRLAQHAYERVCRGIQPDDYPAFDAGAMVGYEPDGSWKLGPNYADWQYEQARAGKSEIIITGE